MNVPTKLTPAESGDSSDEASRTAQSRASRHSLQRLQKQIGRWAMAVSAGGIITWSVFNLSLNLLAFRTAASPNSNWLVTLAMVLITCVAPLLAGFWMLTSALSEPEGKPRNHSR